MRRGRVLFSLTGVVLVFFVLLACEQEPEVDEQAVKAAEDWAWLQETKAELDAKRAELAELRSPPEEAAEETAGAEGGEEGSEEALSPEELAARTEALQQEIVDLADRFGARLAQFINDQGISVGGELTEVQAQAIRMKSDEDMKLAREYIEKGGEYQRAIDIYTQALVLDPDNAKLTAAMAEAEANRYMTEERLAQVKKNMTEDEVRDLLGQPKVQNVREFDGGVIGWFYPKEEPNTAAGVFFRKQKDVLKVYKTDFNAVDAPGSEASES